MICPISKRFLGHFSLNLLRRPDWFRLPAAPIRLAAAKPPSAAACFQTGVALRSRQIAESFRERYGDFAEVDSNPLRSFALAMARRMVILAQKIVISALAVAFDA